MKRILLLGLIFLGVAGSVCSQKVNEPIGNPEWVKPYKPFRIAGNLYYVGTYDLASYLIVTNKGNILINTGLASSEALIKNNIEELGFKFSDVKILLTNQAHYDHLGAMAAIKKQTGAKFYVNAADAEVCKAGGANDYELSHLGVSFQPITPDKLLKDKDVIQLGNTQLTILHHPGHTKGSCSFLLHVADGKRLYKVLIANIPTIITDRKFSEIPAYRRIREDYAYTLKAMPQLKFDLWVAAHASQFGLHTKRKEGDDYNPSIFSDRKRYDAVIADVLEVYQKK